MSSKKYRLTFNPGLVGRPITFRLASDYGLLINILRAEVNEFGGELIISLEGEREAIAEGIDYLRGAGVKVNELTEYVTVDRGRCTDCGMCISLCPVRAFKLDRESLEVCFLAGECIACGMCVEACPPGAILLTD